MGTNKTRLGNNAAAAAPAAAPPSSRFAYHTEVEPEEGGVRSVRPASTRKPGTGRSEDALPAASVAGVPGPAERLLDISELVRTVGMRYTHRFQIPPHAADFVTYVAPLVGEVTLTNTGAILLLQGAVSTTIEMECGRCLALTNQDVEAELEEGFDLVSCRSATNQEEVQAIDEDTPAAVIEGNVLNLGELLRQNVLLAAPSKPLCSEECDGLPNPAADSTASAPESEVVDSPLRHLAEMLAAKQAPASGDASDQP